MRLTAAALAVMMTAGFCIAAGSAVEAYESERNRAADIPLVEHIATRGQSRTLKNARSRRDATQTARSSRVNTRCRARGN